MFALFCRYEDLWVVVIFGTYFPSVLALAWFALDKANKRPVSYVNIRKYLRIALPFAVTLAWLLIFHGACYPRFVRRLDAPAFAPDCSCNTRFPTTTTRG